MIKQEELSIQTQIIFWVTLTIILMATILVSINSYKLTRILKKDIKEKTKLTCQKMAKVLDEATWNLDKVKMKKYFENYPWELSGMARVTVYTEFNDHIFTVKLKETTDINKCKQAIYYNNEIVGYIEISIDQTSSTKIKAVIVRFWIATMTVTVIIMLIILLLTIKVLIGDPIKLLIGGLSEIQSGNLDFRFPLVNNSREALIISTTVDNMSVEIAKRSKQLKRENEIRKATEDKLKEFSESLEEQVQQRTRSLQKAYKSLQEESKERRQLQNEILSISDREQQRIGSDLHDSLGQQLTGVSLLLSILTKTLQKKGFPDMGPAIALEQQMKNVIKEARSLSHGLSPMRLHDDGLVTTLQNFATDTEQVRGITCNFECIDDANVFDENIAMHIYRITQEAVSNAHKHGKADVINIIMNKHQEYETMGEIHIIDNGSGIDEASLSSDGIGLRIMKFRAESIGGSISIMKNNLGGTTIKITYTNTENN